METGRFLNSCWSTNVGQWKKIMLGNLLHGSESGHALRSAQTQCHHFTLHTCLLAALPNPFKQLHPTSYTHWIHTKQNYKSSWLWSAHLALVLKLSSTWSWISWPTSFVLVCLILISDPGKTRAGVPQDYLAWSSMWFHRSGPAPGCILLLYHRLTDENAGSQCVGVVASRRVFHLSNRE